MKKIIFLSIFLAAIVSGYSQNAAENRPVTGFHGVEVSGGIDLYLTSGSESVSVSAANEDIRSHIVTEVVNGVLRIHLQENWNTGLSNPKMKAYVSVVKLNKLEASGGGDIFIQKEITTGDLSIVLSGGGDLEGKLNADNVSINQSGGSNVKLSGNVKELHVNASGGGNLEGFGLITDFASIHSSGGSNSQITVNKELRVVASGGGDVYYKGHAMVKEIKTSGGGSVIHKD
jgi:Putative auto-transporter adhesin, head GIN domain